ncbi:MAG TPA: AAA family ATPase [Candidatus Micrarchaeaceae archaeon]|nr:AAA family ATPase [Candidatus Micrarchaeaceae archaeon]
MFLDHFGLVEQPFGVTPDPRFLCLGPKHREALASLEYGTETERGFLALIGQPGMGKTTLLYQYLELQRHSARSAYVFQTDGTSRDLLRHILADLGVDFEGKDIVELRESLNGVLLETMSAGRKFILVIDEAQNLSERALESIRLLSNFETPWKKLMHIVIAGQPQLGRLLSRPSLLQLRQRVSAIIRLEPFTPDETREYMEHRLWVAGYQGPKLFTVGAQLAVAERSGGIPRNINSICFHAMSLAFARGLHRIDSKTVQESLGDLEFESPAPASMARQLSVPLPRSLTTLRLDSRENVGPPGEPAGSSSVARGRGRSWRWLPLTASAAALIVFAFVSAQFALAGRRIPAIEAFLSTQDESSAAESAVAASETEEALDPANSQNDFSSARVPEARLRTDPQASAIQTTATREKPEERP